MRLKFLSAASFLVAAMMQSQVATAARYEISYTGHVLASDLINQLGEFGGGDLSGDQFVATYVFDTSLGQIDKSIGFALEGGSYFGVSDPTVSASLQINGVTRQFAPTQVYSQDQIGRSFRGTEISDDYGFGFENGLNNIPPPSSLTNPTVVAGEGPGYYQDLESDGETAFSLQDTSFAVSDGTISSAPEPFAWILMLLGVGAIGLGGRRVRRHCGTAAPEGLLC